MLQLVLLLSNTSHRITSIHRLSVFQSILMRSWADLTNEMQSTLIAGDIKNQQFCNGQLTEGKASTHSAHAYTHPNCKRWVGTCLGSSVILRIVAGGSIVGNLPWLAYICVSLVTLFRIFFYSLTDTHSTMQARCWDTTCRSGYVCYANIVLLIRKDDVFPI